MVESILKTIKSVNSANDLFNKSVQASAWSSLSFLRISAEGTAG